MHRLRLDGAVLIDLGDVRLSTTICHVCVLFIRVYTYIYTHTHTLSAKIIFSCYFCNTKECESHVFWLEV